MRYFFSPLSVSVDEHVRACIQETLLFVIKFCHSHTVVLAIPLSSMMSTWLIFHCPCSLSVFVVSIHRYVYEFVDDYGVRFLKDMFVDKWGI